MTSSNLPTQIYPVDSTITYESFSEPISFATVDNGHRTKNYSLTDAIAWAQKIQDHPHCTFELNKNSILFEQPKPYFMIITVDNNISYTWKFHSESLSSGLQMTYYHDGIKVSKYFSEKTFENTPQPKEFRIEYNGQIYDAQTATLYAGGTIYPINGYNGSITISLSKALTFPESYIKQLQATTPMSPAPSKSSWMSWLI